MCWRKHRKVQNFYFSDRKRSQKVDKDGNVDVVTISYKIKFIHSKRFMNDNLIKCQCLSCHKNYSNKIDEKLKKLFRNMFKFSNNDTSTFVLVRCLSLRIYR